MYVLVRPYTIDQCMQIIRFLQALRVSFFCTINNDKINYFLCVLLKKHFHPQIHIM